METLKFMVVKELDDTSTQKYMDGYRIQVTFVIRQ